MTEIPEDIILEEILPWLPAKTLIRFKCVSRRWNAFISTTHFVKTHFQRPSYRSSRSVITLDLAESRLESIDYGILDKMGIQSNNIFDGFGFAFSDYTSYTHLIGSSNGLVFMIFADDFNGLNEVEDLPYNFYYIIYNPINPCLGLDAFIKIKDQFRNHFVIENDFVKYNFSFGFGYVNSFDDYCIVAIGLPSNPRRPNIVVCVYSLRDNQWRTPRKFKQHRLPLRFLKVWWSFVGAMVNDTLHWGIKVGKDRKCIAAFDLVKDEFKMMPLPYPELGDGKKIDSGFGLCNMNDCLCAWGTYDDASVELWMLKEYGVRDSWTYLFRLNLDQDLDLYTRDLFGLTESGKLLIFTNMDGLVLADFSCEPPKYVKLDGVVEKVQAANYVQSLESPIALFANPRE